MKMDLSFEQVPLADMLSFICEFTDLTVVIEADVEPFSIKSRGLTAGQMLELITLPRGLDVKIENASVVVFRPKK